ncbi:MAG: hypothetical protein J0M18_18670 [Ignavibacteria bacterium]|nr:hypothetical protein [Ignavibacteria bacterium]
MENWHEKFNSENCSDKVVDYTSLLNGIDAKIIVVSEDNSKLIAYGNSLDEVLDYVSKGVLIYLPPKDSFFSGHL